MQKSPYLKVGLLWAIGAGFILVSFFIFQQLGWLQPHDLQDWLRQSENRGLTASIIILLLALDLILPIPSSFALVASGHFLGFAMGLLTNVIALSVSSTISYEICRWGGQRAFRSFIGQDQSHSVEHFFNRQGQWSVALTRPIPVLMELMSAMAGLSSMTRHSYHIACFLGNAPIALIYAWSGSRYGLQQPMALLWILFCVPLGATTLWRLFQKAFN